MTFLCGDFATAEIKCEPLRALHTLWSGKVSSDGRIPSRSDFDPLTIHPSVLPFLILLDVIRPDGSLRFQVRLVGTGIVEAVGRDSTGRYLDELPNEEQVIGRAEWMVRNQKPVYVHALSLSWASRDYKIYSALDVPLASDGVTVDKLIYQMAFA
jgi:hypothetical protein